MSKPRKWRFGSRDYSDEEITDIGKHHREDGIAYYPPSNWAEHWQPGADTLYDLGWNSTTKYKKPEHKETV